MKKSILSLFTLLSLLTAYTAKAQLSDKVAAEKLVEKYFDILNAGDASGVTALFTKTGVLLASGAPTATGTEQVNGTFRYVFNNFSYALKVSIAEVIVQGNYAIVSSTSAGTFLIKSKNETLEAGYRETFILEKISGNWKIARYMYNQSK